MGFVKQFLDEPSWFSDDEWEPMRFERGYIT